MYCAPSGGVVIAIAGAVASYRKLNVALPTFPALSVQVSVSELVAVSGPPYVADVQLPALMPLASVAPAPGLSTALAEIVKGWSYQPFESAARSGVMVRTGAVLSSRTLRLRVVSTLPKLSVAKKVTVVVPSAAMTRCAVTAAD